MCIYTYIYIGGCAVARARRGNGRAAQIAQANWNRGKDSSQVHCRPTALERVFYFCRLQKVAAPSFDVGGLGRC